MSTLSFIRRGVGVPGGEKKESQPAAVSTGNDQQTIPTTTTNINLSTTSTTSTTQLDAPLVDQTSTTNKSPRPSRWGSPLKHGDSSDMDISDSEEDDGEIQENNSSDMDISDSSSTGIDQQIIPTTNLSTSSTTTTTQQQPKSSHKPQRPSRWGPPLSHNSNKQQSCIPCSVDQLSTSLSAAASTNNINNGNLQASSSTSFPSFEAAKRFMRSQKAPVNQSPFPTLEEAKAFAMKQKPNAHQGSRKTTPRPSIPIPSDDEATPSKKRQSSDCSQDDTTKNPCTASTKERRFSGVVYWGSGALKDIIGLDSINVQQIEEMFAVVMNANVEDGTLEILSDDENKVDEAYNHCHRLALDGLKLMIELKRDVTSREDLLVGAEEVYLNSLSIRGQEYTQASADVIDFLQIQGLSYEEAIDIYKEMSWKWAGTVVYAVQRRKGGVEKPDTEEDKCVRAQAIEDLRNSDDLLCNPLSVRYTARIIENIKRLDTITICIGHCNTQDSRNGVAMQHGQWSKNPDYDTSKNVSIQCMKAIASGFASSLILGNDIDSVAVFNLNAECTTEDEAFSHCRECNDENGEVLARLMNFLVDTLKKLGVHVFMCTLAGPSSGVDKFLKHLNENVKADLCVETTHFCNFVVHRLCWTLGEQRIVVYNVVKAISEAYKESVERFQKEHNDCSFVMPGESPLQCGLDNKRMIFISDSDEKMNTSYLKYGFGKEKLIIYCVINSSKFGDLCVLTSPKIVDFVKDYVRKHSEEMVDYCNVSNENMLTLRHILSFMGHRGGKRSHELGVGAHSEEQREATKEDARQRALVGDHNNQTKIAIRSVDSKKLYQVTTGINPAVKILHCRREEIKAAFENGTVLYTGQGAFRRELCRLEPAKTGEKVGSPTAAGQVFFTSITFMYRSGVAIETKSGKLLACCKSCEDAASLIGALISARAVRDVLRGERTLKQYNLRLLTDEDTLGLTSKGRKRFGSESEHEYLR